MLKIALIVFAAIMGGSVVSLNEPVRNAVLPEDIRNTVTQDMDYLMVDILHIKSRASANSTSTDNSNNQDGVPSAGDSGGGPSDIPDGGAQAIFISDNLTSSNTGNDSLSAEDEEIEVGSVFEIADNSTGTPLSTTTLDVRRIEKNIQLLINKERSSIGKPPLLWDFELAGVAGRHSTDMVLWSYLSNVEQGGYDVAYRYRVGEVAECPSPVTNEKNENLYRSGNSLLELKESKDFAWQAVKDWNVDPQYSANMLSDYTRIGVGVSFNSEGIMYATANFC